jgi:hypothetical protein
MDQVIKNEHGAWESVRGPHNAKVRRELNRYFWRLFPHGHQESIRRVVADFSTSAAQADFGKDEFSQYLSDIHPEAFILIASHGVDYSPRLSRKPPLYGEPESGACFVNAWKLMYGANVNLARSRRDRKDKTPFVYVEGIALGVTAFPMLHAWNARGLEGRKAIDWTFYAVCQWIRYLGIPFTQEEHEELCRLIQPGEFRINLLFRRNVFPIVRPALLKLLDKRKGDSARAA